MLTIEDIRNPARKSGFSHVSANNYKDGGAPSDWRAEHNWGGGRRAGAESWRGPTRKTPEEAAQDYCDYMNGQQTPASAPLTSHGHTRKKRKRRIERTQRELDALKVLREEAAKRKVEQANYIYLVGEQGDPRFVKIGEAFDPEDRYISGQTFNPRTLVLLGYFRTGITRDADKVLHRELAQHQHRGEWFRPTREVLSKFGLSQEQFYALINYKPAAQSGGKPKEATTA